ncbi:MULTISPECIES: S16 family serine protease [unclassified Methanoregula]|uniref:S16 family serine protease n=1 Tax=unclassified Methanoregula TaxID=2649730 RepID=UPI0009C46531|nr:MULTISPECIES: S16 family serine protease [unclassified Methanoregula]OPX62504.1 MAG: Archaeal Lon protease [Methanoregula sp. PtaB.Bin085]OPY31603.1 MAG: Archaeal Lon protease [Methanoregula sp. PtaU1.Bin006]
MNAVRILTILFALSLLVNIGLIFVYAPYEQEQVAGLVDRINLLGLQNMQLEQQLADANLTIQRSAGPAAASRVQLSGGSTGTPAIPAGITGAASMLAPSVSQSVQRVRNGPFIEQVVVTNGSVMNISVTVQPGQGRVLVETKPLMGIVFQDAANTAVAVAANRTGTNLSGTDILFSIEGDRQVAAVDGPSAGALMALLCIAALGHRPIDPSVTLTGTINSDGHVGAIGGIPEKAEAAKESGMTRFLLPRENSRMTVYEQQIQDYRGFQMVRYTSRTVDAKTYIANTTGIRTEYIDTIDDVVAAALK